MKKYLLDTNILIYYFANKIPEKEINKIEEIFRISFNISVITKIEFLGWHRHTKEGFEKARKFIDFATIISLTNEIADLSIDIRRKYNLKLPDGIIAATALSNDLILVTRNEKDFDGVEVEIYNPFT